MGRFYSTNTPQNIDFVYKPPFEVMAKAIQAADEGNDAIYDQTKLFNDSIVKVNFLEKDRQQVIDKQKAYQEEISGATGEIAGDARNWRRTLPKVRDIGRRIQTDLSTGGFGTIEKNYQAVTDWDKQMQTAVASGLVNPADYAKAKENMLNQYQGAVNPKTGQFNQLRPEGLVSDPKIMDKSIKLSNDMKAGLTHIKKDELSGMYVFTNEHGTKEVTPMQIADAVQSGLMGDMGVGNYFEQGERLGYRPGGYDKNNKNIIPAFTYGPNGEVQWHPESPIYDAVRSRMSSQAFKETTEGHSIGANQVALAQWEMGQRMQMARLAAQSKDGGAGGPGAIDAMTMLQQAYDSTPDTTEKVNKTGFAWDDPYRLKEKKLGKPLTSLDPTLRNAVVGFLGENALIDYEQTVPNPNWDGKTPENKFIKQKGKTFPDFYFERKPSKYENQISPTPIDKKTGQTDWNAFEKGKIYRSPKGMVVQYNGPGDSEILDDVTFEVKDKNGNVKTSITRDALNNAYNQGNKGQQKDILIQEYLKSLYPGI